jgi:hypothetical protein
LRHNCEISKLSYLALLGLVQTGLDDCWSQGIVDVTDGLQHALAHPVGGFFVAQLQSLVDASGGTGWNGSAEKSQVGGEVDLDGWVTARIEDLTGFDALDRHFGSVKRKVFEN